MEYTSTNQYLKNQIAMDMNKHFTKQETHEKC